MPTQFVVVETVAANAERPASPPQEVGPPMVVIDGSGGGSYVTSEDEIPPSPPPLSKTTRVDKITGWLKLLFVMGIIGFLSTSLARWCVDLLRESPIIGVFGVLSVTILMAGAFGLVWREYKAMSRLRELHGMRECWASIDGDRLRSAMIEIGNDLGDTRNARRAADLIDDAGPDKARQELSKHVLAQRDKLVADTIAAAARQSFVMVTASPSPALDSVIMAARAARLLREIAVLYGYRPSVLTIRYLALSAGRDAAAVAVADVIAQAAAEATSSSLTQGGDALAAAGAGVATTVVGTMIGGALSAVGLGMSLIGRTVEATGGAVGGGATAAWRMYRFGLMAMVSARPVPFDERELQDVKKETRSKIIRIARGKRGGKEDNAG